MLSIGDPLPEMEDLDITQLRGQVRQHGSHDRAKGEGPHLKEDGESARRISGDGALVIKCFKSGQ